MQIDEGQPGVHDWVFKSFHQPKAISGGFRANQAWALRFEDIAKLFLSFSAKNFRRILTRIQNCNDIGNIAVCPVVDPIRKSLRKESMMIFSEWMDTAKRLDRTDIDGYRIEKIPSEPLLLSFVKKYPSLEVPFRRGEDMNLHA
jgi:hypothetical protein